MVTLLQPSVCSLFLYCLNFKVIDYFFEMSITISNHCFKDAGLNGLLIVIIMFMVNRLQ